MFKILLTDNLDEKAAELLKQHGLEADVLPTQPREELVRILPAYHGLGVRSATRVDADLLQAATNLKLVVRGGVGVDNIDVAKAGELGIAVANTPGANTIATAELTFALMLALCRHIVPSMQSLTRGAWKRSQFRGVELFGKTLGILGFGRIGREVARRAQAFSMRVLAFDPYLDKSEFVRAGVERSSMEALIAGADFITLHLPLTPETQYFINRERIAPMKDGVRIVNTARGALLDAAAVAEALDSGKIAGVAVDVYEVEPPPADHPLVGHPKVVCVPHLGANTFEAQSRVAEELAQVFIDFFVHRKKTNVINAVQ
ncbi:MAG: hydroxyacid dehydrogenase [candidate division KSB1 bacterium]|nr:hydroxyacid dehydrogenase [candidate division KSB1 bacterium]MDQ7065217.1 hydroxyacid dehydrogenase [candidate division KSB1 bacterium]